MFLRSLNSDTIAWIGGSQNCNAKKENQSSERSKLKGPLYGPVILVSQIL
jgi:hypothetical protein